jgi:hypothetical protein
MARKSLLATGYQRMATHPSGNGWRLQRLGASAGGLSRMKRCRKGMTRPDLTLARLPL